MKKQKRSIFAVLFLFIINTLLGTTIYAKEDTDISTNVNQARCTSLTGMSISKYSIRIRTKGATVSSATLSNDEHGEFCKVLGAIKPVDSSAPDLHFEVNLPSKWNQKALQMGGGAFNGVLVTGLDKNRYDPVTTPSPLARGYVTFGSDSGHQSKSAWDGSFGMNAEALANFAGDQIKKTHDAAMVIMKKYYKTGPVKMYFSGGSNGGREGLVAIQRWPRDYDGAVVLFPVHNWVTKAVKDNHNTQALYQNNGAGWISPKENTLINQTVLNACDFLDGVQDRVISNTKACIMQRPQILNDLRKAGLSDEQIRVIQTFNTPMEFSFPLANYVKSIPGYSQLEGADIGAQFGPTPTPKMLSEHGIMSKFSDPVLRYMVTKKPNIDTLHFHPDEWKREIQTASKLLDASNPNLSTFKALGGKLILVHGAADQIVTPYGTVQYYNQLKKRFGDQLSQFVKFFMVPGYGHGFGGTFNMTADLLNELDNWVTTGDTPANIVTTDKDHNRTRPLCEFPAWPKYKGTGDVNSGLSYQCSR